MMVPPNSEYWFSLTKLSKDRSNTHLFGLLDYIMLFYFVPRVNLYRMPQKEAWSES